MSQLADSQAGNQESSQESGLAASGARLAPHRPTAHFWFTALFVSTTLMQRFGINFGSYSLNAPFVAIYGLLLSATVGGGRAGRGRLKVSLDRLLLYSLCICVALISTILNAGASSSSSLLLLVAMYLPFVFVLNTPGLDEQADLLRTFLNIALLCAVAGVCQFYAQFFIHGDWLFDFTELVPKPFRGPSGFNAVIEVGALHKANGFFFREPSGFSFVMALALVAEYLYFRRPFRLACFALALLLTYSGTGLLALLFGLVIPLRRRLVARLLIAAGLVVVTFPLLDAVLGLSFTLGRLNEFGSEESSAYIRYIAPGRLIAEAIAADWTTIWFGHGPGTISRASAEFWFHDPTWAKLLFEYGVVGFVSFLALFTLALRQSGMALRVRVMLFCGWLIMGGHLLSPDQNFLTLGLVGLLRNGAQPVLGRHAPELHFGQATAA